MECMETVASNIADTLRITIGAFDNDVWCVNGISYAYLQHKGHSSVT